MCMPTVWLKDDCREEEIFKETAILKIEGINIILSTMYGDTKKVKAQIDKIDFLNSRVILKKANS